MKKLTFWRAIFYLIIIGGILYTIRYAFYVNSPNKDNLTDLPDGTTI